MKNGKLWEWRKLPNRTRVDMRTPSDLFLPRCRHTPRTRVGNQSKKGEKGGEDWMRQSQTVTERLDCANSVNSLDSIRRIGPYRWWFSALWKAMGAKNEQKETGVVMALEMMMAWVWNRLKLTKFKKKDWRVYDIEIGFKVIGGLDKPSGGHDILKFLSTFASFATLPTHPHTQMCLLSRPTHTTNNSNIQNWITPLDW